MIRFTKHNLSKHLCAIGLMISLISGCTLTQDYQRPPVDVPDKWRVDYSAAADIANISWWNQFNDPVLNELIETALNENKDLKIAAARVEEFIGRLKITNSRFLPQIGYDAGTSRDSRSLERSIPSLANASQRSIPTFLTTIDVAWEFDIWGRLQRANEATRAQLLSAEEGHQAVILTVVSNVAISYVEMLCLEKELRIYKQTLAIRKDWLDLCEEKVSGGQLTDLELAQARSAHEEIAVHIPKIERLIALKENSLSVLLGRNPGAITTDKDLDMLVIPELPSDLPSDLLARRPDIKLKEQNLIAANAQVEIARTQYLPAISLTGLFGYASDSLSNLFVSSANLWQIGADTVGVIFDGGRIKGEVIQAEAIKEQLLNEYLLTIQTAFREVEDALVSLKKLKEIQKIQDRHLNALEDYVYHARNRFDAGYVDYLVVMIAEKGLHNARINYAQTEKDIFITIITFYKAIGGGWING